jgi:hypothetical protein
MELDVSIGSESFAIDIEDPYKYDAVNHTRDIIDFASRHGVDFTALGIDRLIPRMIRGVAGCENGCPSDAKRLVKEGFGNFTLSYIEGGILSAVHTLDDGKEISVKLFPDF